MTQNGHEAGDNARNTQCIHAIGIGRTGAAYIEALVRTGEVEDLLAIPGTTFAALLIDIGDDDIQVPNDYARSLNARLKSRNIPADRFHYESIALSVPDAGRFSQDLDAVRAVYAKASLPDPWGALPSTFTMPAPGHHVPRGIAKAICAMNYHLADRQLAGAMQRFAAHIRNAGHPATVFVAYALAGGTGSGMAFDIARFLANEQLPEATRIVGVGQLSHSGDGEYFNNPTQFLAIEEIDRSGQAGAAGGGPGNPFNGGFFLVASEQSWQRLSAYTTTGLKEVRQRFKQMVTNRFVADSFMRWAMSDGSTYLMQALQHANGKCTLFDVAKLSHPGVQVLPGEAGSKWDAVLQQWIGFVPKYSGLNDHFKTNYAQVHVHAARDMQAEDIDAGLKAVLTSHYLAGSGAVYRSYRSEFFDELTAYGNVILPGAGKDDLASYPLSRASFEQQDAIQKALEQT